MKLYQFQARQQLPISIHTAWEFFSDPRRLVDITPAWLKFRVTSNLPDKMYAGMIITYQVRPFARIPINWVTEITHVQAPFLFVDEQRYGPYRLWHHQHLFKEVAGGVEMIDLVHYALPFGPVGRLLNRLSVARRLQAIFAFRRVKLEQVFASSTLD